MSTLASTLPPRDDIDATQVPFVRTHLYFMTEPEENVDAKTRTNRYMGLTSAIFNYCKSPQKADDASGGLIYDRLDSFLKQHLEGLRQADMSTDESYLTALRRFKATARRHQRIFNHVDRHYVVRMMDEKKEVHDIYALHVARWNEYMGVRMMEEWTDER
ncbi:uncharacterized protein BKCO1_37000178 [Diplodia corticola]|uniref:Cullin N-terminal domain-containing protein n=1 Tax=Diplodia corticola TaxID=236234 RepID=A0A1J9QVV9_9PEZI|nr:uncharacterized protein BKCO1_37000178 [Diplodia corticola]OJD32552.1 hypothetical protein BKCO1_37000178 [Diplodia corticola]